MKPHTRSQRPARSRHMPWVLLLLLVAATAVGDVDVPYLGGYVNDTAGMLSSATVGELTGLLRDHEKATSDQVVVLTVPSLEGESIEEFAIRVVETWKLGTKKNDNGVLFLISRADRKLRIEVGDGLQGVLTDALSNQIIRHEVVPRFKEGDFNGGVKAGVQAILGAIAGTYTAEEHAASSEDFMALAVGGMIFLIVVGMFTFIALATKGFMSWFLYVFLMPFWLAFPYAMLGTIVPFVVYVVAFPILKPLLHKYRPNLVAAMAASGGSSGWHSGSSSGGWSSGGSSFSGGGGSFSGGGSSGSW